MICFDMSPWIRCSSCVIKMPDAFLINNSKEIMYSNDVLPEQGTGVGAVHLNYINIIHELTFNVVF